MKNAKSYGASDKKEKLLEGKTISNDPHWEDERLLKNPTEIGSE